MPTLIARSTLYYAGSLHAAGTTFEAKSESDAMVLVLIKKAQYTAESLRMPKRPRRRRKTAEAE